MQLKQSKNFGSENAVLFLKERVLDSFLKKLDEGAEIAKIIEIQDFQAKSKQILHIPCIGRWANLWLVGVGEAKESTLVEVGSTFAQCLVGKKIENIDLWFQGEGAFSKDLKSLLSGIVLRLDTFHHHKTDIKDKEKIFIDQINFISQQEIAEEDFARIIKEAESVKKVRYLVNQPPNLNFPASMVEEIKAWLGPLGVKIKVLSGPELKDMGALNGVAMGSAAEPYVVIMHIEGDSSDPVALVGKGVTFDSGGLSLKPSGSMETMKCDMAGAATVCGIIANIASLKIKKNVVGIIGLVENMPSSKAQRPGDIVKSLSGKTIEVLNTDAEGRLVLADILWYVQQEYKPKIIIDFATLTGAVTVALGNVYGGLFANDDDLADSILRAGKAVNEEVWRLPMHDAFDKAMDSEVADMQNISKPGTGAGSATAAMFLKRFIKDGVKWAHLDIAGVAHLSSEKFASPKGGTGFGVRLISDLLTEKLF